ncbi:MAG: hypothetical protein E7609_02670 [Ruminococcaceae bacterium]|nr:hypothetical protein [Oscillospiraceae bacterium]
MKKKQQKRGKYNAKAPLSKKQRKKLEKRGVVIKTRAERERMPREKKWLISLIAAICVLAIACASFGAILLARAIEKAMYDPYASVFDTLKMGKHLNTKELDEDFYTGNIFNFADFEASDSYQPMTMADMDAVIDRVRINHRTLSKELQKQAVIGLGDTVAFYITDLFKGAPETKEEEKANRLVIPSTMQDYFGTYTSPATIVVGDEFFGKDFDQKLIALGAKPEDTVRETRENGKISLSDTVCITYYMNKSKKASSTPYAEEIADRYVWDVQNASVYKDMVRVDLDEQLDARLSQALVDNCPTIGEFFSFVLEDYDITGKGASSKDDYKVTARVVYALTEETTKDITFTVPEIFTESDGDFYALNGKTATMRVTFLYVDDYELPTFDRAFITDTLKMEITATDDAGAVAEYKEKKLAELNEQIAVEKENAKILAALNELVKKAQSSEAFLETTSNTSQIAATIEALVTRTLLERCLRAYGHPPTQAELDEYTVMIANTQGATIADASEYISAVLSSEGKTMLQRELLVYHIFRAEGMKITDAALDKACTDYLDSLVGAMSDPETHNAEYFVQLYGEATLKSQVRRDLVYAMVGEFLLGANRQQTK